ncbi:hypothetical protein AAFF_G00231220 [Aldrovandia affinis]|uniref:Uncharacterized protein n=1 Tax=Aldrovandia affinis TaxID=143900 RepID=A0AAD7W511_9TELE|nr:hypothetical protein AAFF_G00231220 [Aldrovandia affinis]
MVDHLHELFADHSPYASYELMPVSFESDHGFSETPGQSADVAMTKPTTVVPEAQTCVEANIPRSKTDDGQPKNLDFNQGVQDFSKLGKERQRKAKSNTYHL